MRPTVVHAFVFLSVHLSHRDDEAFQKEEREVLTEAAHRLGLAAKLEHGQTRQMVYDAVDWYYDVLAAAREGDDSTQERLEQCADLLQRTFSGESRTLQAILRELYAVAEAHRGVQPGERSFLAALQQAWDVETAAP